MTDTTIKAGSWCPVCRGITMSDCEHDAREFNAPLAARNAELLERERCARIAERIASDLGESAVGNAIAVAIRAKNGIA